MKIILASASPRRSELLRQIGLDFQVQVSRVEESFTVVRAGEVVEQLSARKAEAVLAGLEEPGEVLVIGADTVVALEDRILGKPDSLAGAEEMLRALSGRTHQVYTGVTLLHRREGTVERKTFHEMTKVTFFPMTDKEIAEYAAGGECMDKAGAYGIQGMGARYIREIQGDYNNVVGLPVGRLYQEIKEWIES